jgi:NADPH-dependent curcumin reductase CurA
MVQNKAVIFKKVPVAAPVAGETLVVESSEFDLDTSPPTDGITSKTLFSSLDPYMRGRMREPSAKSYSPPFALGEPLTGGAVFQVLKSANAKFKSGDVLVGFSPMAEYAVIPAEVLALARVIDNPKHLPLSTFLGALGMTGLTAYASLQEIGKPKKGETIFISAASGAVGQVVGQIAKNEGLKVIGSVGSDDKLKLITETLGFDAGFNYKKESVKDALPRLAPEGIDIYYENVGGEHLEAALGNMNTHGRIGM